ncbi:short-subunit dehydrogenase [Solirubrobacter pauli]|uniref:Short-subunit dehydrogenase n=1 Tax=Solirubrobacter pauli TaxID=166793 RepID=A0A660KY05_9ACTN|nr:oxidoreductase [Solirubrobacter pauli]RKQ84889.1 short-subunit dehydrogenase [Solirubrobacter pauli]
MHPKIALVTGASSGIGETTARHLLAAGFVVYGAARRIDRMADLAAAGMHTLALDVTDEASVADAVAHVLAEQGRIDVLVNNAGYGSYGALEDVPMREARAQVDVNLFGLAHLTQLVLPAMRAQGSGTIINIASMGGQFATPLGAWYHASKFAVEGLSDALRLELRAFGIDVVVIEPGSIRTEWGAIAADKLRATSGQGPYRELAMAVATSLEHSSQADARLTSPPEVIARAVTKAASARRPRTRYRVGFGARPLVLLSRILPARTFDRLITRAAS